MFFVPYTRYLLKFVYNIDMDKHTKQFKGKLLMAAMATVDPNPVAIVKDKLLDLPLLQKCDIDQDNPHHNETVLNHCLSVLSKVSEIADNPVVRMAALFHDCGKPDTKVIDNGKARFHGHDKVGAKLAADQLRDLDIPKDVIDDVALLISLHMRPLGYINQKFGDRGVRRLINKAQGKNVNINDLLDLNLADIIAHVNAGGDNLIGHQALRDHIRRLS